MASKHRSATAPRRVKKLRATRDILRLREAGLTIREIHARLDEQYRREFGSGIGRSTVHRYLQDAIAEAEADISDDIVRQRALQSQRLSKLLRAHWPHAIKGHLGSTDRVLRIMDQYNRLHGLYAKERHEVEHTGSLDALLGPLLAGEAGDGSNDAG